MALRKMDDRSTRINKIASIVFAVCFVTMVAVGSMQDVVLPVRLALAIVGTLAAFLGSPLFGRLGMTWVSFFFVSGILRMSADARIQFALLVIEAALIVFYIGLVRTGKCKDEQKVGGIALVVADVLLFADVAMTHVI